MAVATISAERQTSLLTQFVPEKILQSLGGVKNILATIPQNITLSPKSNEEDWPAWIRKIDIHYGTASNPLEIHVSEQGVIFLVRRAYVEHSPSNGKQLFTLNKALSLFAFYGTNALDNSKLSNSTAQFMGPFLDFRNRLEEDNVIIELTRNKQKESDDTHKASFMPIPDPYDPMTGVRIAPYKNYCNLASILSNPGLRVGEADDAAILEYLIPEITLTALGGASSILRNFTHQMEFGSAMQSHFGFIPPALDENTIEQLIAKSQINYNYINDRYPFRMFITTYSVIFFLIRPFNHPDGTLEKSLCLFLFNDPDITFIGPFVHPWQKQIPHSSFKIDNIAELTTIVKDPKKMIVQDNLLDTST